MIFVARLWRGGNLPEEQHRQRLKGVTFAQSFVSYFEIKRPQLGNGKHIAQWTSTMEAYVLPHIGQRPVAEIEAAEIIALLKPIWFAKPETASRVLQRVEAVFESAIVHGDRKLASPCVGVRRLLGGKAGKVEHYPALPYQDVPAFMSRLLCDGASISRSCLAWVILTACRSGEARGARCGTRSRSRAGCGPSRPNA